MSVEGGPKTVTEKKPVNQFKVIEKISLIKKDGEMYEVTSVYKNIIDNIAKKKNKVHILGLGTGSICIGEKGKLELNISNEDSSGYQKIMAQNILIDQFTKTKYQFNDEKKTTAIEKMKSLVGFSHEKATHFLEKMLINGKILSYKIIDENDIKEMGGEDKFKHVQAILRSIGGHEEEIKFCIGPMEIETNYYYIKPGKLKNLVNGKKEIKNLNPEHIFLETIKRDGIETEVEMVYVKVDKDGVLTSVKDKDQASINYFQFDIEQVEYKYSTEKSGYERKFKKVGFINKEFEENGTAESKQGLTEDNNIKGQDEVIENVDIKENTEKIEKEDVEGIFD